MAFIREWLNDPELKGWLIVGPEDESRCPCGPCMFTFKDPNRSALMKHAGSGSHKKAVNASAGTKLSVIFPKIEGQR